VDLEMKNTEKGV